MNIDEISLVNPPAYQPANSAFFVRSDSELCQHYDITNVNDIFAQINQTHVNSLKTALKSVYPFVPSISNSEYYFIHPAIVPLGSSVLGVFALTTKTFSGKLLYDPSQIAALAYEIEFELVHRSGMRLKDEFSPLSTASQPGLQALGVCNAYAVEHAPLRVSGSSTDVTTAKDMLYAYFYNGFQGQLFAVHRELCLAGAWGYSFRVRGHLVAQGTVYCALGFNLQSIAKLNAGLRVTPAQLAQRIVAAYLRVEALQPGIAISLSSFEFGADLDLRCASGAELSHQPERENETQKNDAKPPTDAKAETEAAIEEFSYDDTAYPQAAKQSFLTKLFTKQEIPDDIFVLQAQKSNFSRINPGFKQSKQTTASAAIVYYTNENIREKRLTMLGLQFSGGESAVYIGPAYEIRIGSKYGSETLKLVMCNYACDVYVARELRASCPSGEVVVRLLEKGSCAEVIEVDM